MVFCVFVLPNVGGIAVEDDVGTDSIMNECEIQSSVRAEKCFSVTADLWT